MRDPIAIEIGTETAAHGVVVPDLPGCCSAGDRLDEAVTGAEAAAAAWIDATLDAGGAVPAAASIEAVRARAAYAGWALASHRLAFRGCARRRREPFRLYRASDDGGTRRAVAVRGCNGMLPALALPAGYLNEEIGWCLGLKFRPSSCGGGSGRIEQIGFDTAKQHERRDCAGKTRDIEAEPRTYIE